MAQEPEVKIRKFEKGDRDAVRRITHDNAFLGELASVFFEGREILSDALTLYFTDYEPESCFVASVGSEIVGCLIGARSKAVLEKIFSDKISLRLVYGAFKNGVFLKMKNIIFILRCLWDMLRGKLITPDFTKEYPAIFHINVRKDYRGSKIGAGLTSSYLNYLKEEGVPGVHLATMSDRAANFFSSQGFQLLFKGKRSYFRHILHKDVPLYIYGMKLVR